MVENKIGYAFCSIKEIIQNVESGKWILPVWQRDYVWKKQDIAYLFDSIYRQYPIGNILLWKTKFKNDTFCNFKTEAIYKGNTNLTDPSTTIDYVRNNNIEAILDGQQRVTSLFLALSDKTKIYLKNDKGSNEEELYVHFNILSNIRKMKNTSMIFAVGNDAYEGFRDVSNDKKKEIYGLFMRLDHIFSDDYKYHFKALHHKEFSDGVGLEITKSEEKKAVENIKELRKILLNTKICIKIIENEPNEAFEIFHRLNSSGTELSATQLSTCKLIYLNDKLKSRIHKDLQLINGFNFEFDVSYIVNLLYLMSNDGKLKDKKDDNDEIVKYYEKAIKYTKAISKILYELGLGNKIITSYNAILPMTYYLYQNNTTKVNTAEREAIKYFMYVSMIKGLFGGSSKDTINRAVGQIKKINSLSIDKVKKLNIKKNVNNNFIVNQEVINDWLSKYKKGDSTTKLILYILYSKYHFKKYAFHEDHMQADSEFRTGKKIFDNQKTQTQIRWQNMKDLIPNLQLLESRDNIKKSNESLKSWLAKYPDYYDENYLPSNVKDKNGDEIDITLLENFDFLFNERKELITKKLCEIFGVKFKSKYGK